MSRSNDTRLLKSRVTGWLPNTMPAALPRSTPKVGAAIIAVRTSIHTSTAPLSTNVERSGRVASMPFHRISARSLPIALVM